ncbi:hypothetical protein EXIGLDRAFT_239107 [Exidia glandulosa HHB12029]|uniref:Secreted protein n=1 Tax=Exidia glandulosa HHB12029 TaxID=1314781 RepID=A0A165DZ10_EXIGL|nr:hypothetical protein EXIGLDRAFT_239107 [Exidia glandulosa HHB12029]
MVVLRIPPSVFFFLLAHTSSLPSHVFRVLFCLTRPTHPHLYASNTGSTLASITITAVFSCSCSPLCSRSDPPAACTTLRRPRISNPNPTPPAPHCTQNCYPPSFALHNAMKPIFRTSHPILRRVYPCPPTLQLEQENVCRLGHTRFERG